MHFGEKLRMLRKKNKWSQNDLASKAEINVRAISKYENNEVLPNADTVLKIAKVLDTSIDYLLLDKEKETLQVRDSELEKLFYEVDKMESEDRHVIKLLIDAFVKKRKLENIIN